MFHFGISKHPTEAALADAVRSLAVVTAGPVYAYAATEYGPEWFWIFNHPKPERADLPVLQATL